jgi:hypothetical protein
MGSTNLPFELAIAKPCEESWAEIRGSNRERHCTRCNKQVHNLSAMSSREIEKLITAGGRQICARLTHRLDGSLVTLQSQSRVAAVARIAASTALVFSAVGAAAQSVPEASEPQAVISGKVLTSDGSGPLQGAAIILRSAGVVQTESQSDSAGNFEISVTPGIYDVEIKNERSSIQFRAMALKEGQQSMPPIATATTVTVEAEPALMGEVAVTIGRPSLSWILRHPIAYGKHLMHKL